MRKLVAFICLLGVVYALAVQHGAFNRPVDATAIAGESCNEQALSAAYSNHQHQVQVCGTGVVTKVLKDDTQGSRHQRFIVRMPQGQTILIAYNFDIAPRIDGLRAGSPIEFVGEYEWNGQGGVVHWTHHDPSGRHATGWIRYSGRQYQ